MNRTMRFVTRVYGRLIGLLPVECREEFGEELQMVFSDMVRASATQGRLALLLACLREFRDFPLFLLREHLEKKNMKRMLRSQPVSFAVRGAVGLSLGLAALNVLPLAVSYWLSNIPLFWGDPLWLAGIPAQIGYAAAAVVGGVLFALLFAEPKRFSWYTLVGILALFTPQAAIQALYLSLAHIGGLSDSQNAIISYFAMTLVGALLGSLIQVARGKRIWLRWPLLAGAILFPVGAYSLPRGMAAIGLTHSWLFVGVLMLLAVMICGWIWVAARSDRKLAWLVPAAACAFLLSFYICRTLLWKYHLYLAFPVWPQVFEGFPFVEEFNLGFQSLPEGILFGLALGLFHGRHLHQPNREATA